jgi:hypothetical protein
MQKSKIKITIKNLTLSFAVLSFIFLIFSPYFVFAQSPHSSSVAAIELNPINIGETGRGFIPDLNEAGVGKVLEKVMSMVLGFFTILGGLMFIIFFVLGALSWLTGGGKSEQLKRAQEQLTNALIGLIIVVASYAVFYIVGQILGLNILNPAQSLLKLKP